MGARCSARAALYSQVKKLIFMTYPIVRGLEERFDELVALTADIDVLMIIGDEDALAPEQQLKALRSRMRARTWWLKINKGDHALWFGDAGQRYSILNICGQIAARWSMDEARDPTLTESFIGWNGTTNRCEWTPWTAPAPEPVRGNTRFNIDVSGSHMQSGGGNFTVSLPP
jgi:dienelactone hydrolase